MGRRREGWALVTYSMVKNLNTANATLLGQQLGEAAVLLGHFGQEWSYTNCSACKTSPVNQVKICNRTWVEESLATEDNDEDGELVGNSRCSQACSTASPALLCQAGLQCPC